LVARWISVPQILGVYDSYTTVTRKLSVSLCVFVRRFCSVSVQQTCPDVSPHSIAWRPGAYQIEIACDAGRLSRPILLCKDGKILFDKPSIESWSSTFYVNTCYKRTGRSLRTRRQRTNQSTKMTKKGESSRHYVLRGVCRLSRI
jgi:hypothetical protein